VAKDRAVRYLMERHGLDPDRVVYAGDSGNDGAAMLAGYWSIVVGNASSRFKEELRANARDRGVADRIYFAERSFAEGVIEGCRHFGLLAG
jgi:hydroxymethylpyrimidine pyrophosphatase-like HAD family hydrolase